MKDFEELSLRRFRETMGSGIYVRDIKPLKTHNATKSSIKNIFIIGAKFEQYNNNGIRQEYANGEPKLVIVVKLNTRSCWLAPLGTKSQTLYEGTRRTWDEMLTFYNNGNYQLHNP